MEGGLWLQWWRLCGIACLCLCILCFHLATDPTLGLWKVVCGCTPWVLEQPTGFLPNHLHTGMVLTGMGVVLTCLTHPIPV